MCQFKPSTSPTINSCQTRIGGANGEAKRTTAGKCHELNDFHGNFQPKSLTIEMHSDFIVNITTLSKGRPKYIEEENFGVTDTTVYIKRIQINGSEIEVGTFKLKTDQNQSLDVTSTVSNHETFNLSHTTYMLKDGEKLCVQYQALGGGFMKRNDFRTNKVLDPLPYKKTSSEETVCYRYDDTRPQHCLMSVPAQCSNGETEPLQIFKRVIRNSIIPLTFTGWIDPLPTGGSLSHASGIESYEISVNEVVNGIVSTSKVFSQKLGQSDTSLTLNLTSDLPRLYAINLEVKDVADNVQQARRFVLYDSNTYISSRDDKPFFVSSASVSSKYMWQTHHNDICLYWKDHFMNKFYMENSLLGEINPDPHGLITGIYEQETGILPVTGTPNVYGITEFRFSWSLNGNGTADTITVPNPLNQSYCHLFALKDGQTYDLNIVAVDIVNNTLSESRKVHIDRTVPHINNIWLTKGGVKQLYVHDDIDLSKMNLTFEALDPHSGLLNIEWTFGIMDSGLTLGTGVIGIAILEKGSCSNNSNNNCYCPDIGKCENYKYSVPLKKLVPNNTHIGTHNRNYRFTIKATNNAKLSNIEQIDVLVDDSPPERGVVYEGALGSYDIDYTSDDSFIVRWHGFIDHESGIKEYHIGLAEVCLSKEELIDDRTDKTITPFTASSIRLNANFTGKRFVSVIAVNNAMEESDVACSDGIIRDVNPPSIQNIRVENAKWSESIFCFEGNVWRLRSDLQKVPLSNSDFCKRHCKNGTTYDIHKLLPTEQSNNSDTRISEFWCNNLPTYDQKTIIYIPNDYIFIRWDINESLSQIEEFYVGFGNTPANSSAPSTISYKSTTRKPYFHSRHLGIGTGDLFFVHIKAVSKAKLETVLILGPMMIDETPPYFKHKPVVSVSGDSLMVGWNNDTIYDFEQTEIISSVLFQIVHDGMLASPLLEWKFYDSVPCHGYTGGCIVYPLEKLQRIDTDVGLNFTVRMYAYNNAGHFSQIETDPFLIPSTYPPGHVIVTDIDPEEFAENYQDIDVHFTPNKVCSYWDGFRHHENVSIEIGLGTSKTNANVIPFHTTSNSKRTCINSADIHFNIQYFVFLRATCSGGKTISTSNGILVVNETEFIQNLEITVGDDTDTNIALKETETKQCTMKTVEVGKTYKLRLINVKENVSVKSDDFIINKTNYKTEYIELDLDVIPLVNHPCITIDPGSAKNMSIFLIPSANGFVRSSKGVRVTWNHMKKELLVKMTFNIALVTMLGNTSSTHNITQWTRTNKNSYSFDMNTFQYERNYSVALMPCVRTNCLEYTLSKTFQTEHVVYPGEIQQSVIRVEDGTDCVNISISWLRFQAVSKITIYQWSVSRDIDANVLLLDWKSAKNEGQNIFEVKERAFLPVHGHSTLFLCVRAYSAVGNVQTKCQMATLKVETEYSRDTVYDLDMNSSSWETIKEMIHSSNIGTHLSLLHNAEIDFGTVDSTVAGVLLHAGERNVTWYLMKERKFPQSGDCDVDTDCVHSQSSDRGYIHFDSYLVDRNRFFYICAYSGTTMIIRETFTEKLPEILSCSNGFVIDDTPPTAGKISVKNTNGFLTDHSSIDIRWSGFDDNIDVEKLGYPYRIKYFSYAIGTHSGSTDIRDYTMVGNAQVVLEQTVSFVEGTEVYVSVKATDHAGHSVTTTTGPLIIDSSPPSSGLVFINHGRKNIVYISSSICTVSLEGFKDDESGVAHFKIGLGSNKGANDIEAGFVYISDHFSLQLPDDLHDGHEYYVTVEAVNRANLSGFPVSVPFVVDLSPPTGGHVIDGGWNIMKDVDYQSSLGHIHGHWKGFMDPHSGIKYYRVGLGTKPQSDDIEDMVNVGLLTDVTWNGTYYTGQKFYITVQACNAAELCRTVSSDGVLLDNTPPIPGVVRVGSGDKHQKYLPLSSSVHVQWAGFEDPHSGIDHYETCLGTEPAFCDILPYSSSLLESSIIKTGLVLKSGINIYATVTAYNKAGMKVTSASDAFQIDDTPPLVVQMPSFLFDFNTLPGEKAQWEKSVLRLSWQFTDDESKIASHIICLKTHHEGHTPIEYIHVGNIESLTLNLEETNWLHEGDTYYVVVTSCNMAGLCASARSDSILIDSTPPSQGGFKSPLTWQNMINSEKKLISRITVNWYGFTDVESSIDEYYLLVSRNYSGDELSDGVVVRKANNHLGENATVTLSDKLSQDDILILSLWAKNNAGMNSTVSKISVNALLTGLSSSGNSFGILEIQKHSCDIHFCNKDCTCAILGKQCVEVDTNDTCTALNKSHIPSMKLPEIYVFGGLPGKLYNSTASSACLAGHWKPLVNDDMIQRYEWSMGIKDYPVGEDIFDIKLEQPWKDVGKRLQSVYCLYPGNGLKHNTYYVIYVRAWYSKNTYATFSSDPILVDHTPPQKARGIFIKDSDRACNKDYDVIDWMDRISACWNGVFMENQGKIIHYTVSLGTTLNGSDVFPKTNVGLLTNISLSNLTLSHGTKYFFTVTAYNNVGLHTSLSSDGFSVDMDTPVEGVVFNTDKHTDMNYQSSTKTFNISWHGFLDKHSGIRSFRVAIVEHSVTDYTNVSFLDAGFNTKYNFRNLNLSHGMIYRGVVRATDNAGHSSRIVTSNQKLVDHTPPSAFSCNKYETKNVKLQLETTNTAFFYSNLTFNEYYVISGKFSNMSDKNEPTISIGRKQMYLPIYINNNGSVDFEYSFLSQTSGNSRISISATKVSNSDFPVVTELQILRCSLIHFNNTGGAVTVKQSGSSRIYVNCKITDKESSLFKVHLGAGTTPGGFQISALSRLHGHTSGFIDVDVEQNTLVYITVIAENHAGQKSVFAADPLRIDKTPPYVSAVKTEVSINSVHLESNETRTELNLNVSWEVDEKETRVKYCLCGLGTKFQGTDIVEMRLSDTVNTCTFSDIKLHHGDRAFFSVKCTNDVELGSQIISKEIVISTTAPVLTDANIRILSNRKLWNENLFRLSTDTDQLSTFAVTDRSQVRIEWGGFQDPAGLMYYEYRIMDQNRTIVDWKSSGLETMVDVSGLFLDFKKLYKVEVRATNSGKYTSHQVSAGLVVYNEPLLTGRPISFERTGKNLAIDWDNVFYMDKSLPVTYDVTIGTRFGFSDIAELRQSDKNHHEIRWPTSTLVTLNVTEIFISITCTQITGLFNVYNTNYKL